MRVSLFDFALPEELIATRPAEPRDAARMLVVKEGGWQDSAVKTLPDFLNQGDVLVFNDTRVIPARLHGTRGTAKVEVLLHKRASGVIAGRSRSNPEDAAQSETPGRFAYACNNKPCWHAFARPAKRLNIGDVIIFADGFSAELLEKNGGEVALQFNVEGNFLSLLSRYGQMPLPPYIEKKRRSDVSDKENYQTVYANERKPGAVAAPTAGLHFTQALLKRIEDKGVHMAYVTLHVGAGTFLPVKADDTADHAMHSEWMEITERTARAVNDARANGGRIIAVGTTSLRALESAADDSGNVHAATRDTDIFITPGYRFKAADMLLTNFHLPKSTLFMLVSAFSGLETMQAAYAHAIEEKYRFYSYGDACLLYRNGGSDAQVEI